MASHQGSEGAEMKAAGKSGSGLAKAAAKLAQDPTTLRKVKRATRQIIAGQVVNLNDLSRLYERKRMAAVAAFAVPDLDTATIAEPIYEEEHAEAVQA
jgi:hypothetical protein